ncbi:LPS export ABC transporter protein LptC [Lewinella marina]|uniref:LPS export ABC transporter periplasmic protein LptC n=1 Tax=Neolewinella marina TaxID=438751 RepID=A0A2G0CGD0_9BACT|nr:LPS export ABC transporter periplasmic protein LptC [Neolewinella marina]NJB86496.1 LPS export ABC transporter protein LptC [Neolewinella marina]PHK99045.1 LPS export ABC transporter periplasmic protein LptC [Neolewinella marina]
MGLIRGLTLCLLLTGCVNDPAEVARLEETLNDQVELAEGVRILYSDSARVRLVLEAPRMLNHLTPADPRQEFPDGVTAYFLDENQDTSSTLVAQYGVYRRRNNLITVSDSVVWQSATQQRLETEELNWDEQRELIYTNKFVVLTQPDYIITGYGLESDPNFTNARVLQVDGRIPVNRPAN